RQVACLFVVVVVVFSFMQEGIKAADKKNSDSGTVADHYENTPAPSKHKSENNSTSTSENQKNKHKENQKPFTSTSGTIGTFVKVFLVLGFVLLLSDVPLCCIS